MFRAHFGQGRARPSRSAPTARCSWSSTGATPYPARSAPTIRPRTRVGQISPSCATHGNVGHAGMWTISGGYERVARRTAVESCGSRSPGSACGVENLRAIIPGGPSIVGDDGAVSAAPGRTGRRGYVMFPAPEAPHYSQVTCPRRRPCPKSVVCSSAVVSCIRGDQPDGWSRGSGEYVADDLAARCVAGQVARVVRDICCAGDVVGRRGGELDMNPTQLKP